MKKRLQGEAPAPELAPLLFVASQKYKVNKLK